MFGLTLYEARNDFARFFDDDFFYPRKSEFKGIRTDVIDNGDSYSLEAELPGFTKEDIDIAVNDGVLTIKASHTEEKNDDSKGYVYRERHSGSYSRSFDISGIDEENISAEYKDGILNVTLPKIKEVKQEPRKIALN